VYRITYVLILRVHQSFRTYIDFLHITRVLAHVDFC